MADDKHERWTTALHRAPARESWRSLEELFDPDAVRAATRGEFPPGADQPDGIDRRQLLQLLGASMALAGAGACTPDPPAKLLPYTTAPRETTPGVASYYATSMELDGYATGVLVKSIDGRPIKIEGNPDHPASLGGTGVFEQASVLGLYDPDRASAVRSAHALPTWDAFQLRFGDARADRGAGLRFLLEPSGSPLVGSLMARILRRFPAARFTFDSPARSNHASDGATLAFGRPLLPQYDFRRADVVLALDADFLAAMPFSTRYARAFAERRRPPSPASPMNRLYVVESMLTPTGSMADHRVRRRPSEVGWVAASIAAELIVGQNRRPPGMPASIASALTPFLSGEHRPLLQAITRDLLGAGPASIVITGDRQPPAVHALAHLINAVLGNTGAVDATDPVLGGRGPETQDFASLVADIRSGRVDTLVMLGGNPAYTAPADVEFGRLVSERVPERAYLGLHENETAAVATWFLPARHYLESWGDARAYDGTISLIQPLIRPLRDGHILAEVLAVFAGDAVPIAAQLLRDHYQANHTGPGFEAFWQSALQRGFLRDSALPRVPTALRWDGILTALSTLGPIPAPSPPGVGQLEASFVPDPAVHDGRFANNAWLQELPRPTTKLTWDNAAMMSPATARRLGAVDGAIVELELRGRKLAMPALVIPGHADDAVTLPLGYGRRGAESLARGVGFDAYRLRSSDTPFIAPGLTAVVLAGLTHELARTQSHWSLEGRPIARKATLRQYRERPELFAGDKDALPSLLPPVPRQGHQWAMTIDTSICTSCSSCVVACQAENNVLVVGKQSVLRGREMHWLRIDTYYSGSADDPSVVHEPMLCQHCERAPCEYVCPVNATVHSPDGLNEMVYNRCVGTRFCSNNCPYKVRRFNWFDWSKHGPINGGTPELQRNPDVTVRARGVMEKCSYCVQRIRETEIKARIENRDIAPREVVTACQQACPTGAIQFGSLAHEGTPMVEWRREPRAFGVLHELGTAPRTQYLARIDNPNPEIR